MIRFIDPKECACGAEFVWDPSGRSRTEVCMARRNRGIETPALPQDQIKTSSNYILNTTCQSEDLKTVDQLLMKASVGNMFFFTS